MVVSILFVTIAYTRGGVAAVALGRYAMTCRLTRAPVAEALQIGSGLALRRQFAVGRRRHQMGVADRSDGVFGERATERGRRNAEVEAAGETGAASPAVAERSSAR